LLKESSNKQDMSIHHQEPQGIKWILVTKPSETIKWTISKEKYEIYHGLCLWFELHKIIPHCLMVMHKIDGQVGDNDNKNLQLYKQVLPQTLSIPLVGVWAQLVMEFNQANQDDDESLETFAKTL
jgi:sulfur relay (sulfurtransferase) DsrC/TusE family protein